MIKDNDKEVHYDNIENKLQCCNEKSLHIQKGEFVCQNCGMVFQKQFLAISQRAFNQQERESRINHEVTWRNFGPRTYIKSIKSDSKGNLIKGEKRAQLRRLSMIQNSLTSSLERNLSEAKPKLKYLCSKMHLPSYIKETAWKIYKEVPKQKLTFGRSIQGFISASVYAAIRIHKFPRLLDEVCEYSITSKKIVHRLLSLIVRQILPLLNLRYQAITPKELIYKFGIDLKYPLKVQHKAAQYLEESISKNIDRTGKDPRGFAAAALYLASKYWGIDETQANISKVARITDATLRNRLKQIKALTE